MPDLIFFRPELCSAMSEIFSESFEHLYICVTPRILEAVKRQENLAIRFENRDHNVFREIFSEDILQVVL